MSNIPLTKQEIMDHYSLSCCLGTYYQNKVAKDITKHNKANKTDKLVFADIIKQNLPHFYQYTLDNNLQFKNNFRCCFGSVDVIGTNSAYLSRIFLDYVIKTNPILYLEGKACRYANSCLTFLNLDTNMVYYFNDVIHLLREK